jgi:hypothetical protein
MPPYDREFSTKFFKIKINFKNSILLAINFKNSILLAPNIQKINFLAPPQNAAEAL